MDSYHVVKRHKVALCNHVSLSPWTQVCVKAVTKISGHIHTEPKDSFPTGRRISLANAIHIVGSDLTSEILLTSFSAIEKKLPKEMIIISCTTTSQIIHLTVSSTMVAAICESLNLVVHKAMTHPHGSFEPESLTWALRLRMKRSLIILLLLRRRFYCRPSIPNLALF